MEGEVPCVDHLYQRMVKLLARAFYKFELKTLFKEEAEEGQPVNNLPPKGKPRKPPPDFTGLGVVVMDALLNRPWWEEEEFARLLRLPMRPVRQVLRLLETQYLVAREHRKEKRARKDRAGNIIAEAVGADAGEEGEGLPERGNLISYCSLDYQRMFDMARWRLHKMRQSLKAELEDRSALQEYVCPACHRTYTTLHAAVLIKPDGQFHCEEDDTVLEAGGGGAGADGVSRKERAQRVKAKQAKLEEELKPLAVVLGEIEKRLAAGELIPDFGTLGTWAAGVAERSATGRPDGGRRDQAAEIRIQMEDPGAVLEGSSGAGPRVLPPWLQAQTPTSGSHSVTQDARDDFSDVKSTEPGDKKLSEDDYMRDFKQRLAAQEEGGPNVKRQKTEGGWEEVGPTGGAWQEVQPPDGDGWQAVQPSVKQELGAFGDNTESKGDDEEEDEWEDA